MAPFVPREAPGAASTIPTKASQSTYVDIVEAWGEGFHFGGLVILMLIVLCNLRRHVLLHKLVFLEQFLALWHATIIFFDDPVYGWYLSSTVVPLYISYFMHNVISWMKIKPFLSRRQSWIYMVTLILVEPYWAVALWTNYENFNGLGDNHYEQVRPWEALAREPWWVFTTLYLVWTLKSRYHFGFWELLWSSPRFSILIICMGLSIAFAAIDAAVVAVNLNKSNGINPFWRMSLVFKCASDTIFLDDFKRVLDTLVAHAFGRDDGQIHAHGRGRSTSENAGVHHSFRRGTNDFQLQKISSPSAAAKPPHISTKDHVRLGPAYDIDRSPRGYDSHPVYTSPGHADSPSKSVFEDDRIKVTRETKVTIDPPSRRDTAPLSSGHRRKFEY